MKRKSHNKKKCPSCKIELDKLKKLCQQKGLQTSFTKNSCSKHKEDKTIVVFYNQCKCNQIMKRIETSLNKSIHALFRKLLRSKSKKTIKSKCKFDPDAFIVEDDLTSDNETIQFEPPIITIVNNDDESNLNSTDKEEVLCKPRTPEPQYALGEHDSLGLFKFTQDEIKPFDKVAYWTQYGYPYLDQLQDSEYEIPEKVANGWVSPALSPILA